MAKAIKVRKWISTGNLEGKPKDTAQIIEQCGALLDQACTGEIIGPAIFKAADGKNYIVTVEAVISELAGSPRDVLGE